MVTRRQVLGWTGAAAAAGGLGLTGCSGGGGSQPGTLRFGWWGNSVRQERTQQVIDLYRQRSGSLAVEGEPGDWGGYWDKLATSVAASDGPDVQQQVDPYLLEYAQRGSLVDLTTFPDVLDLSPYDALALEPASVDGAVYGVPTGLTAISLWVNTRALEAAGEPLPDDATWSWEEYAQIAERVSRNSGGATVGGWQPALEEQSFTVFVRQQGGELFDGDSLGFDEGVVVDFWRRGLALQEKGAALGPQESVEAKSLPIEASPLATGRTAFGIGWNIQLAAAQATGAELRLLQIPGETTSPARGAFVKASQYLSVSAQSGEPEAAAGFVDFFVNSPEAGRVLLTERGIPANAEVLAAVTGEFAPADVQATEYLDLLRGLDLTPRASAPQGGSELGTLLDLHAQTALFEQESVEDAAANFVTALQQAIA